jgi:hypothetical protein
MGIIAIKVLRGLVGKDASAKELFEYIWTENGVNSAMVGHVGMKPLNENIKLVIDSELTCKSEFPSWKQSGRVLKNINNDLYNKILQFQNFNDFKKLRIYNIQLKQRIISILKNNGFSEHEINDWENCNLEKITFQYR